MDKQGKNKPGKMLKLFLRNLGFKSSKSALPQKQEINNQRASVSIVSESKTPRSAPTSTSLVDQTPPSSSRKILRDLSPPELSEFKTMSRTPSSSESSSLKGSSRVEELEDCPRMKYFDPTEGDSDSDSGEAATSKSSVIIHQSA